MGRDSVSVAELVGAYVLGPMCSSVPSGVTAVKVLAPISTEVTTARCDVNQALSGPGESVTTRSPAQ